MGDLSYLRDLVVILGLALIVVTVFHRFRIPSIAGFILAGILVGPKGFGFIKDVHQVEILSEIGVALLLFGIGTELSLDKLRRLWRPIVIGGFLQVSLTIGITFAVASFFEYEFGTAMFIGFLIAISSTAIVLRGLEMRGEVEAPHGRLTLGILVFQDLSVVPMILLLPILSSVGAESGSSGATEILWTIARAIGILILVLISARLIVPRALSIVANTRQRDLFILAVFVICIGIAWLASISGVSLAIGAFLAGLVVAGGEFRHQALADLIPFRDVFSSLFFISIGMLLAPSIFVDELTPIIGILVALMVVKFIIVFISGALMKLPLRVVALSAVALAQVGEFSFVLINSAEGLELLDAALQSNLIAAAILSMLITPFAISFGPKIASGAGKIRMLTGLLRISTAEDALEKTSTLKNHVIIGGYGFTGIEVAYALKMAGVPYVISELNPENIRRAASEGEPVYYGDITNADTLVHLGAQHASELILAINDPSANERAVRAARSVAPDLHIIVRTRFLLDIEPLMQLGASEVVPAELEAAVEVTSRALRRHEVDPDLMAKLYMHIRSHRE